MNRISSPSHFVHVPTPGDHYSPATGSAVITIIAELTRIHDQNGERTTVLVSKGTQEGYPAYPYGVIQELPFPEALPSRGQKLIDAMTGAMFLSRPYASGKYSVISEALGGSSFDGVLFVHNAPHPMPILRRMLPNAKLVLYAHNQLFNTFGRREIRHVINSCDAIFCCSQFIAADIARRAEMKSPRIKTVLNGVNIDHFGPAVSPPAGPPVVLFIGRILPEKGPDPLLKAAVKVAAMSRPFRLRIIGSQNFDPKAPLTPYEQELRALARPISDIVEFRPFIPRPLVPEEYRRASIFVVPSNWDEPFGLTLAEALACGLPSIASRRGGLPEVAGDAALYFQPPQADVLAEQLCRLLDDPALRTDLSTRARKRAEQLSWPTRYLEIVNVLGINAQQ